MPPHVQHTHPSRKRRRSLSSSSPSLTESRAASSAQRLCASAACSLASLRSCSRLCRKGKHTSAQTRNTGTRVQTHWRHGHACANTLGIQTHGSNVSGNVYPVIDQSETTRVFKWYGQDWVGSFSRMEKKIPLSNPAMWQSLKGRQGEVGLNDKPAVKRSACVTLKLAMLMAVSARRP